MRALTVRIPTSMRQRPEAITARVLAGIIIASVPALLAGLWAAGQAAPGQEPLPFARALAAGAGLWSPRIAVALVVSLTWAVVFSRARGRTLDAGWLYGAWFFVLLLPAAVPLSLVAIGLSFGLLFGCHAFGGTGRYFVSPALLGVAFLELAYPAALGREVAALGAPSAVLCLAGAGLLVLRGLGPWRVLLGGLVGMLAIAWLIDAPDWPWQPVTGSFALVLAFVATDPTTAPESRAGQWSLGLLFGAITVVLRTLNPEHPESSVDALLLACVAVPLIDHWAVNRRAKGPG